MNDITNFVTSSLIIGVIASLIIEGITRIAATKPTVSKIVSVAVCLVLGTGYYFAAQTEWWPTVVAVLAVASGVYAFLFNRSSVPTTPQM